MNTDFKLLVESICLGKSILNSTEFWSTLSVPVFNRCFQQTVPVWLTTVFLWASLPFHLKTICSEKRMNGNEKKSNAFNALYIAKLATTLIIVATNAVQLLEQQQPLSPADLSYHLLNVFNFSTLAFLINIQQRRRNEKSSLHRSTLLWRFTFLSALLTLSQLYMAFIFGNDHQPNSNFLFHTAFLWMLAILLTCFDDRKTVSSSPRSPVSSPNEPHPLSSASLISRLTYSWVNTLLAIGYRKPLTLEDLWPLREKDSTRAIAPVFDRHWKRTSGRLLWTLLATFRREFLLGGLFELLITVFIFIGPQLMKHLLRMISSSSSEGTSSHLNGYLLALLLFTSSLCLSASRTAIDHIMFSLRQRIRTALNSAIYRKSLLLRGSGNATSSTSTSPDDDNISSSSRTSTNTTGEIINLMSTDITHIFFVLGEIHSAWSAPLMAAASVACLWAELGGRAAAAGVALMAALVPFTTWISRREERFTKAQMAAADERLALSAEVLATTGARFLKFFGWEDAFERKIASLRRLEVAAIGGRALQGAIGSVVWTSAPALVSLASFAAYILLEGEGENKNVLDPATAFVSLALFEELRFPLTHIPQFIAQIATGRVALRRVEDFLRAEEVQRYVTHEVDEEVAVSITGNACFAWQKKRTKDEGEHQDDHCQTAPILSGLNLKIRKGSLVAIVGKVGSGKSSLLSAILGNMILLPNDAKSSSEAARVNIAAGESVAYVGQCAWIANGSLRSNILLGSSSSSEPLRYRSALEQCALLPDLATLPAGELTEIGEKGINLSGGQRARVALARAVHSAASLLLLDDPLSAVDSHVARHIFRRVLSSRTGVLRGRTRLLVTHSLALLPEVDQIVVMEGGRVAEAGTYQQLMADGQGRFAAFVREHANENARATKENTSSSPSSDQLITAEHLESGRVSGAVSLTYFRACGWPLFTLFVVGFIATEFCAVASDIWLARWANEAAKVAGEKTGRSETLSKDELVARQTYRLIGYGLLAVAQVLCISVGALSLAQTNVRSSVVLHRRMLRAVLHSPMRFFETTPLGRITNRLSKDLNAVDSKLSFNMDTVLTYLLSLSSNLLLICLHIPFFVLVILPTSYLYYRIQTFYTASFRQLSRLQSVLKSPIFAHFGETLGGLSTIRAFSCTGRFTEESAARTDALSRVYYASFIVTRWLSLRLELLGNVLVLAVLLLGLMAREQGNGLIEPAFLGLVLSYSLGMIRSLNEIVRNSIELETNMVAVERIEEYCRLEQEKDCCRNLQTNDETGNQSPVAVPDGWPSRGRIQFTDYAVRYRPELKQRALDGLNLTIEGGEKVAIVGRTGSGKSTLTLGLFRLLEADQGRITIDGVDIASVSLPELRKRLSIIPQEPVLFTGTIRSNLDPFGVNSDERLMEALAQCHLLEFVAGKSANNTEGTGLDFPVAEGGSNLSVGQRALLCLGRALLRRSQIVVLDEATAAIDLQTEALIQKTIRSAFAGATVLTIAHRLSTVLGDNNNENGFGCDRVVVLEEGQVLEFESPSVLLANPQSRFYKLAKDAKLV